MRVHEFRIRLHSLGTKSLIEIVVPKVEDGVEASFYKQGVNESTERSERKLIVHAVGHFDAFIYRFKPVQVMPKPVRTDSLFVHEIAELATVADFGNPRLPYEREDLYPVFNDLPRKHRLLATSNYFKVEKAWGHLIEILRIAKKVPNLIDGAWDNLFSA